MTDLPSSLGIEAVECLSNGGKALTVRVIGRWRRRRPEVRGQPMLVVESAESRQRFLAMPEPPSLTGAAPGTWRMSFSVPAALAPLLPGRTFLQLGGVMVPLPIGEVEIAPEPSPAGVPSGEVPPGEAPSGARPAGEAPEERAARDADLAADAARERATELSAKVERLERELRSAEQHVHAEQALRADVERELSRRTRAAQHDLRALHDRVADLERELSRMRRAVDEAQHLAAAADARRAEAERRVREPAQVPEPVRRERAPLGRRELELHRLAGDVRANGHATVPVQRAADRAALRLEAAMAGRRDERTGLRLVALEAELRAAREEIEAQRRRTARAYEAIELVRTELRQLRVIAAAPAGAALAPAPGATPPPARVASPEPIALVHPPAPPVQPERLTEALARLRERTPASPAEEIEPDREPAADDYAAAT